MATVAWGSNDLEPITVTNAPGAQTGPAVADNGGTEFGVAWVDGTAITVKFFDEQGLPSAALPTSIVTDGTSLGPISGVHMSASGVSGYGVVWQEGDSLRLRYIAETGVFGPEIAVSSTANVQHDAAIAGYSLDDATGRPNVENSMSSGSNPRPAAAHSARSCSNASASRSTAPRIRLPIPPRPALTAVRPPMRLTQMPMPRS